MAKILPGINQQLTETLPCQHLLFYDTIGTYIYFSVITFKRVQKGFICYKMSRKALHNEFWQSGICKVTILSWVSTFKDKKQLSHWEDIWAKKRRRSHGVVREAVLGRQQVHRSEVRAGVCMQQQEANFYGRMKVEQLEMLSERYRLGAWDLCGLLQSYSVLGRLLTRLQWPGIWRDSSVGGWQKSCRRQWRDRQ